MNKPSIGRCITHWPNGDIPDEEMWQAEIILAALKNATVSSCDDQLLITMSDTTKAKFIAFLRKLGQSLEAA